MDGECVKKCAEASIESAARRSERLFGFQHDRELHDVEAAHPDERARSLLAGDFAGVAEGVARLAQRHFMECGGQVEIGRVGTMDPASQLGRHVRSQSLEIKGLTF